MTIADAEGKTRQQIRLEPSAGAIHFLSGEGPLFGLGEGGHPLNRRGTKETMVNGQHSPELATLGARSPIPWLVSTEGWGIFFAHPWGTFDLTGQDGTFVPTEETPTRDVFVILAETPAELMKEWAELTGYPHMPPLGAGVSAVASHTGKQRGDCGGSEAVSCRQAPMRRDDLSGYGILSCRMEQGAWVFHV
jgi:hypothetical protein